MRQHRGHFRFVLGQGQQSARDIHIAARNGKSIDHVVIQDRKGPAHIFTLGIGRQACADARHHKVQVAGVVHAELAYDFAMFFGAHLRFVLFRDNAGKDRPTGGRAGRAFGKKKQSKDRQNKTIHVQRPLE